MNNQLNQPTKIPQTHQPTEETSGPPKVGLSRMPRKKTLFFAFWGLVFIIVITGSLLFFQRRTKAPSWQGVRPGNTKEEIIKVLGTPMKEEQTLLGHTLLYQSDNKAFPNTIISDEKGIVESIFVQVPADKPIKFSEWLKDYGQPEKEMYNSYSDLTKSFIFPRKGVAVVANKEADQIYSVHYFQPTNLKDYLSRYSNYLFEESPYLY